jgi:ubiquitin C-terminal hydrolase
MTFFKLFVVNNVSSQSETAQTNPNCRLQFHPAEYVRVGLRETSDIGAGMENLGNICYMNAMLQVGLCLRN